MLDLHTRNDSNAGEKMERDGMMSYVLRLICAHMESEGYECIVDSQAVLLQ